MDTIEETRRKRLEILIGEYGSLTELADILFPMSNSQISQWRNASPNSKSRRPGAMGSDSARYIEDKTKKPVGWMDQPVLSEMESLLMAVDLLKNVPRERLIEIKTSFPEIESNLYKKKSKK